MTDQRDLFSKGLIRNPDRDTSIEAAEAVNDHLSDLQELVFTVLDKYEEGLTDEELRQRPLLCGLVPRTVDKRRTDLMHKGMVIGTSERRVNSNGRKMIVWKTVFHATDEEIEEWRRQNPLKRKRCACCGKLL